jgi:hypothetical protein
MPPHLAITYTTLSCISGGQAPPPPSLPPPPPPPTHLPEFDEFFNDDDIEEDPKLIALNAQFRVDPDWEVAEEEATHAAFDVKQ